MAGPFTPGSESERIYDLLLCRIAGDSGITDQDVNQFIALAVTLLVDLLAAVENTADTELVCASTDGRLLLLTIVDGVPSLTETDGSAIGDGAVGVECETQVDSEIVCADTDGRPLLLTITNGVTTLTETDGSAIGDGAVAANCNTAMPDYETACADTDGRLLLITILNGVATATEFNGSAIGDGAVPVKCEGAVTESTLVVASSSVSINTTIPAGARSIDIAIPAGVTATVDGVVYTGSATIAFLPQSFGNSSKLYPAIAITTISGGPVTIIDVRD